MSQDAYTAYAPAWSAASARLQGGNPSHGQLPNSVRPQSRGSAAACCHSRRRLRTGNISATRTCASMSIFCAGRHCAFTSCRSTMICTWANSCCTDILMGCPNRGCGVQQRSCWPASQRYTHKASHTNVRAQRHATQKFPWAGSTLTLCFHDFVFSARLGYR